MVRTSCNTYHSPHIPSHTTYPYPHPSPLIIFSKSITKKTFLFNPGFCLTNCISRQKCISCHFGPWPIYWVRWDFRLWGVDFLILSFCLTNCIGDQKCIFCHFWPRAINWARRNIRFWVVDFAIWIKTDQVLSVLSFCLTNCISITMTHMRTNYSSCTGAIMIIKKWNVIHNTHR